MKIYCINLIAKMCLEPSGKWLLQPHTLASVVMFSKHRIPEPCWWVFWMQRPCYALDSKEKVWTWPSTSHVHGLFQRSTAHSHDMTCWALVSQFPQAQGSSDSPKVIWELAASSDSEPSIPWCSRLLGLPAGFDSEWKFCWLSEHPFLLSAHQRALGPACTLLHGGN